MIDQARSERERRVLVLPPSAPDGEIAIRVIADIGLPMVLCADVEHLIREVQGGAAALVVTEELGASNQRALADVVAAQPEWSDLPIVLLARQGADSMDVVNVLGTLGNVILVERPVRATALVSAMAASFLARERQYQLRDCLGELRHADERVRTTDRSTDEFLATLGHALRNPLASILTGVELVRLADLSEPHVRRAVAVIDRQVNMLVRLVDDLLEVSRVTRGAIEIRREPLDLSEILQTAADSTRASFDGSGQVLVLSIAAQPIPVLGDAIRLTQVFTHLLNNAAKYSYPEGHIKVVAEMDEETATVSVEDQGVGLDNERLTSIFDMFVQVDRHSRRRQGGLGIGLTLVRSLVAMHGGEVEARSEGPGRGCQFIVRLPLLTSCAETLRRDAGAFPMRRILVVDDNEDAADNLGALLTALGAVTKVAHSGEEALDALASFSADCVLLDIGMPNMDGYEVVRRIRASHHVTPLLVALTGWGQDEDRRRSRAAGFDVHLVKPPDLNELGQLLERRKQRRSASDTNGAGPARTIDASNGPAS